MGSGETKGIDRAGVWAAQVGGGVGKGVMVVLGAGLGMDLEEDEPSTPTRLFQ